jgi:SHS family lactate transporter-like MFS transporter
MFMVGALPALLVLFIRRNVEESPAWKKYGHQPSRIFQTIKRRWGLFIYVIILMTAFNSFSHGTQDIYPTFLQVQQKFPAQTVSAIAIVYNIGAILGGIVFGTFSERIGRRRAVVIAALLTLPVIPLWAFSNSVVKPGHQESRKGRSGFSFKIDPRVNHDRPSDFYSQAMLSP